MTDEKHLLQDLCKRLGRWFADRLGSREQLRKDIPPKITLDKE